MKPGTDFWGEMLTAAPSVAFGPRWPQQMPAWWLTHSPIFGTCWPSESFLEVRAPWEEWQLSIT